MMNLHEIPSLEAQTLTFVQLARALNKKASSEILEWQGFRVSITLLTETAFSYEGEVTVFTEAIVLREVFVPEDMRRKGWFSSYCEICKLITRDAVILMEPHTPHIIECVQRRGFYWYPKDMWIYRRAEEAGSNP